MRIKNTKDGWACRDLMLLVAPTTMSKVFGLTLNGELKDLAISRQLSEGLAKIRGEGWKTVILPYRKGLPLVAGEESKSGLYLIRNIRGTKEYIATYADLASLSLEILGDSFKIYEAWLILEKAKIPVSAEEFYGVK